jgi:hypothetical protein
VFREADGATVTADDLKDGLVVTGDKLSEEIEKHRRLVGGAAAAHTAHSSDDDWKAGLVGSEGDWLSEEDEVRHLAAATVGTTSSSSEDKRSITS